MVAPFLCWSYKQNILVFFSWYFQQMSGSSVCRMVTFLMCIAANGSQDVLFIPFCRVLCSAGSGPLHDQEDKTLLINLPISSFFLVLLPNFYQSCDQVVTSLYFTIQKLTKNWSFSLFAYWWSDANEILAILVFFFLIMATSIAVLFISYLQIRLLEKIPKLLQKIEMNVVIQNNWS